MSHSDTPIIHARFVEARRSQMRLVDREEEIRAEFKAALGREVSTGWHTETCPEGCDDGSILMREGFQDRDERWVECWICQGEGVVTVRDDPKWGWALEMEIDGAA